MLQTLWQNTHQRSYAQQQYASAYTEHNQEVTDDLYM